MEDLRGLQWDGHALTFIEQTMLPGKLEHVKTTEWRVVVDAIRRLAIRGAPAIGVAGACAGVLAFREANGDPAVFESSLTVIENARPTAVNLAWAVNELRRAIKDQQPSEWNSLLADRVNSIAHQDEVMCGAMATHGAAILPEHCTVLTHCNTGALVTYGIGTALGVIRRGHELGKVIRVYACEARPLGQGARLTMWELDQLGIPGTLLVDSAAGYLLKSGKIDLVIVGADRIAANGDTANKIGTLNLAVLARRFGVPFYVAAPSSTFDPDTPFGEGIHVEFRGSDEVRSFAGVATTIPNAEVFNPAFDITPAEEITAFITESGIHHPPYAFTAHPA